MGRILKNPRHESFVKVYLQQMANGGTAKAAYERVYRGPFGPDSAKAAAWRLLNKPKIKSRIKEMRMDIKRKADITFEKILTDYQDAMVIARGKLDAASMISAATAQAKLVGLLIDRKEVGAAGDFENMESISDILQAVEQQAGAAVALALGQAFGALPLPEAQKAPEPTEDSEALVDIEPASDAMN